MNSPLHTTSRSLQLPLPSLSSLPWQKEMQTAFRSPRDLSRFLEGAMVEDIPQYPLFVPLSLAQKIKYFGVDSPLGRQFLSHSQEREDGEENEKNGFLDPIGDHRHSRPGQIIHRYGNRLLFLPTTICPVACRYCFRKNELTHKSDPLFTAQWEKTMQYLWEHTEVQEIICSGGDPLVLGDEKIAFYLQQWAQIPHIKYIRFHSRVPVILPQRITPELVAILRQYSQKFKKLILVIHTNHVQELWPDVLESVKLLRENHIELLAQTVLLKGVNDHADTLQELFETLVDVGVRPYYLHHPDRVQGGMHFYLPLEQGRKIYGQLRERLSGWAIPQYVVDLPEGAGKVWAYNPEGIAFGGRLLNRKGVLVNYF